MSSLEKYPRYIGGLMRCCIATLDDHGENEEREADVEGSVLPCKYCTSAMILKTDEHPSGFAWHWFKEYEDAKKAGGD